MLEQISGYEYFRENELELWQRCDHPNVVKIFELYDPEVPRTQKKALKMYLLMQLGDMGSLGDVK